MLVTLTPLDLLTIPSETAIFQLGIPLQEFDPIHEGSNVQGSFDRPAHMLYSIKSATADAPTIAELSLGISTAHDGSWTIDVSGSGAGDHKLYYVASDYNSNNQGNTVLSYAFTI